MTALSPHGLPHRTRLTVMERLAGWSQRRHWTALAVWVALVLGVSLAARSIGDDYANGSDVSLPGTQSEQLAELLEQHAPDATGDTVTVVLHDERGWDSAVDVGALVSRLGSIAHVDSVTPPDPQRGTVSPDGTLALVELGLDGQSADAPAATYEQIIDVARAQSGDGLQVEAEGWGIRKVESAGGGAAEGAGLLAALLILVFMFGSLLAATLPLITATFAVGTTFGLAMLVSHLIAIPDYATSLLVLVGLGVGIDYALLVFSRFRSELLSGADREQATRTALDTAGRSVLFAGASVIIALLGMFTLGVAGFEGTVTAVALTVLVTMAASITLLPALLTVFGRRLENRVRAHAARRTAPTGERWRRWAALVQRAPWPAVVVALVALGALALPAAGLRLGLSDAGTDPTSTTARAAYDLVSEKLGPGANGPLLVAVEGSARDAEAVRTRLAENPAIVADRLSAPTSVADGVWLLRAEPVTGPQDAATADLVERLREQLGDSVLVGGQTAAGIDFSQALAERFPLFVVVVVGLSGLLLMSVFRSVAIAVKAALLNLLSIGAALGAMRLVFQDGRLGADAGPIEAFLPVFIFAIVFGLSMDYEVFLLSRMREEWLRTGDAQRAVREGLAHTGGVITAAAAIMVVIFGSFVLFPDRMLQQAGFAMAVAVLLDAVVIRCLVVPAVMRLLGARAWWLPRALDRWLPHLHIEGRTGAEAPHDDDRPAPVVPVGST